MQRQNWLITGVSTGLGRAFAQAALSAGHTVVGTVRSENDVRAFEELGPGHAHGRILDVTDGGAVNGVVAEVERSVGPLDVVVANAGYGLEGTFEETPLAEVRRQFDVNVFGAMATLQAALPHMRARRRGHLMAVTSMGGLMAVPGMSAYCGSKFALEGILEALGKEVAQFGIHVTAIEPGSFRTDWAGRSMTRAARTVADYDDLFAPIREARQKASGNQLGNPAKAGKRSYTSPRSISRRPTSFWARTRCDWSPPRVRQWMRTSERGRRCRVRPTSPRVPSSDARPAFPARSSRHRAQGRCTGTGHPRHLRGLAGGQGLRRHDRRRHSPGRRYHTGALYFYFGSKHEVVAALVARTVEHLWERSRVTAQTDEPRQAIAAAMHRTVELWNEHGLVMRTAIDLSLTVPEIGELWSHTADLFIAAITAVLERAGIQSGTAPEQASAMARALCWMIERTFYHASQESREKLQEASATCEHIWLVSAGLIT